MDLMQYLQYFPRLLHGLGITVILMLCSLALGSCLAIVLTLCSLSKHAYLRAPVDAFVFFIRGTPLLVQIFLIYFGLGQFEWIRDSPLWWVLSRPFPCAIIALALNTCAYTIVLLKGAINSVPYGEVAACEALGMSKGLMLRRIILPRAFRIALPAYSNEVIMVLKGTSLASTITILDLMGVTNQIIAQTYATIPFLLIAGALYLILNSIIVSTFKLIELRAHKFMS